MPGETHRHALEAALLAEEQAELAPGTLSWRTCENMYCAEFSRIVGDLGVDEGIKISRGRTKNRGEPNRLLLVRVDYMDREGFWSTCGRESGVPALALHGKEQREGGLPSTIFNNYKQPEMIEQWKNEDLKPAKDQETDLCNRGQANSIRLLR